MPATRDQEQLAASFEQERAYVLDRLIDANAALNIHRAWILLGSILPETFQEKLSRLMARHEILRTGISDAAGGLTQIGHKRAEPDFTYEDLSSVEVDQDLLVQQHARAFVERPFDLGAPPLWRVLVMRLGEDHHVLLLTMHSAIADAETLMLAFKEILASVGSSVEDLPTLRQYRDYAAAQQKLDAGSLARQEAYWLDYLRQEPEPTGLPVFRHLPPAQTSQSGWRRCYLPAELIAEAESLAASADCSLSTILMAGFGALLYRYSTGSEVTFGYPLSARSSQAGEVMLGPCGNLAVMRLPVSADTTFEEATRTITHRLAEAEANKDFPFQHVVRALKTARDSSTSPLFQLIFESELDLDFTQSVSRPGLDVDDFELPPPYVDYDVRLTARRLRNGLVVDWAYNAGLFEPELIAQVSDHFAQLLSAALRNPGRPVSELDFLSPTDIDAIAQRWNTVQEPTRECLVHQLIEEQSDRTPHAIAVEFQEVQMSYLDLNAGANRLARHLISLGASKGEMVGLCMDRSAELVVAVLAILKAGCVVVPLDAAYPQERLQFMLTDAGVRIVVTSQGLVDRVPALGGQFGGLIQVRVDESKALIEGQPEHNPEDQLSPDTAAYCIYTSGSTGQPKGAVMEHRALVNLVTWHDQAWLAEVGTRTLLYSPISFDVSFHEILVGLCTGATLVQVDEATRCNPIALLDFARQHRIEKWYMPFVTLQQIAQAARTAPPLASLKELIVGGEVLRITPEVREFARQTGCVIHNHYGSTECIDVATYTLSGDPKLWPSVAPIGYANVRNMNLYILDESRQLLPIGAVGEIYGEGESLARNYHGRPDLTGERFGPSPFGIQGTVLYRMGDLGRYLPDGTIECLGRADGQIKIRGFRVETGEVEVVLAQHPSVAECVVAAKATAHGRQRLLAYVVGRAGYDRANLPEELRQYLGDRLPDYMVPLAVIMMDALPLTPSGKVAVRCLPDMAGGHSQAKPPRTSDLSEKVSRIWGELLELPEIDPRKTFFELGGDSILLVRAHQRIEETLGRDIPPVTLFRYPTVEALLGFLGQSGSSAPVNTDPHRGREHAGAGDHDVAIIGMACRVPGAQNLAEFWANLRDGVESVVTLSDADLVNLESNQTRDPHFVPVAATIHDIDQFDAEFFSYSPAEAAVIDPQQRLFLECAWEAVEDAGVDTNSGRVGVFAGASLGTYLINNVLPAKLGSRKFLSHRHFDEATELRIEQGNSRDHLTTRVSFKLNLRGPSVNVQSTCSTSLVAVHLASQALLSGECEVALAGGVSIITPQNTGYLWRDGMMLSSDGHCRAFDAGADGTVFGDGIGAVVLKRLSAAVADGDHIYAVIKGSAVNNDGAQKLDYSGPSVDAQADVISQAHRNAGVSADEISYVEAHGTATKLGDPIEIAGLHEAFRRSGTRTGAYCAIGSVKTNLGHLDEAAGVVGLIKTALSLYHEKIPPSLHFRTANPLAGLESSPFFVNTELRDWQAPDGSRRRAGVSSFGMGGTNCHVVLEEPPTFHHEQPRLDRSAHVLPISGRSQAALRDNIQRYVRLMEDLPDAGLADICFSAATGRKHFEHRVAVLAGDLDSARSQLVSMLAKPDLAKVSSSIGGRQPSIGFLLTGQGSQYTGMGQVLYQSQPVFRAAVDQCDALLQPLIGRSLLPVLYGPTPDPSLDDTGTAQPALFVIGYALSKLWESWGISADVLVGHSLGECVAACVAGVFSLEDGLRLVAARGRLMQELPRVGGMVQVNAGVETVQPFLVRHGDAVSVAAVNTPDSTVISGRSDALGIIQQELQRNDVETIPLNVSHASHSRLMEPMLDAFRAVAETIHYSPPTTDILSNVTGSLVGRGEMESADYWVRHIINPVLFSRTMKVAEAMGVNAFVELGAKPTLSNLGRRSTTSADILWLPSLTPRDPEAALTSLQRLFLAGANVDWSAFDAPFPRRRVPVPTYAFQRQRHWLEPGVRPEPGLGKPVPSPAQVPVAVPVQVPVPVPVPVPEEAVASAVIPQDISPAEILGLVWEPVTLPNTRPSSSRRYVIVGGPLGDSRQLAESLRARGHLVEVLATSDALTQVDPGRQELHVVFMPEASGPTNPATVAARALDDARTVLEFAVGSYPARRLWFITRESVLGTPMTEAELGQSGLAAVARTINVEHPELSCLALAIPASINRDGFGLVTELLDGTGLDSDEQLALSDGRIYRASLRRITHPGDREERGLAETPLPIRADGVYLITGGTGGIGLQLALDIARRKPKRLVLLSRAGRPSGSNSQMWSALTATGVEVELMQADVADEDRMRQVLADCGPELRGLFHCAGSLNDGILLRQSPRRFAEVLRPKVAGGWVLHQLTKDRQLDFFLLFSSLSTLLGYEGQASYAFANGFLDSLARHRRENGLTAHSVSWGSWSGPGMTDRLTDAQRARHIADGETFLSPQTALAALAELAGRDMPHAAVVTMDWARFADSRRNRTSMIRALAEEETTVAVSNASNSDFRQRLRNLPPEQGRAAVRDAVLTSVTQVLGGGANQDIDPRLGFEELGIDSLGALDLRGKLQTGLGITLPATVAFDHPDVDAMVTHLEQRYFADEINAAATPETLAGFGAPELAPADYRAVAIIGMSFRFPDAATPEELWQMLVDGRDAVRDIPSERWDLAEFYDPAPDAPGKVYVKQAAHIEDAECFDAAFFGISPREAACMDPRHRLLLEAAWSAIEHAGIDPSSLRGSDTAVYLGGDEFTNDYLQASSPHLADDPYVSTGTTLSFAAGRMSYKLGLHGPSMVIATACSSSLVALHSAVRAIRQGDCGMAIVGAAKLNFGPMETVQLCKLRVLAPDGRSKAFSAAADGLGRGEGCAAILLKRLDLAIADGDPVLGVIRGTSVNHDGPSSGLTVPNAGAQVQVVARALADARVDPADVTYVETHGAGTPLGDPIEVNALNEVFHQRVEPLRVGSVKANIGHLEEAAGLAGVIKTVLALRHGVIPPQIHCDVLSDQIDWANIPVAVERSGIAWPPGAPRIAGVSSFGASGTNAHVIIEASPPRTEPHITWRGPLIFTFSARDGDDLRVLVQKFVSELDTSYAPAEVAYTLQTGRKRQRQRLAVVAPDTAALVEQLEAFLHGRTSGSGIFRSGTGSGLEGQALRADALAGLVAAQEFSRIAELWCAGQLIDWRLIYGGSAPRRVGLPTYPFKRERVWITERTARGAAPELTRPPVVRPAPEAAIPPAPVPVPQTTAAPEPTGAGLPELLCSQVSELLGIAPSELSETASFHELGADSLTFMRIGQYIRDEFQIVISFQQLIEEADTLQELTTCVSARLARTATALVIPRQGTGPDRRSVPNPLSKVPELLTSGQSSPSPTQPGPVAQVTTSPVQAQVIDGVRTQMGQLLGIAPSALSETASFHELGADSLTFMRIGQYIRDEFQIVASFQQLIEEADTLQELAVFVSSRVPETVPAAPAPPQRKSEPDYRSGPSQIAKVSQITEHQQLTGQQARFLADLIDQYVARTSASKAAAARERSVLANCRMPAFRVLNKEMSYPIIVERSAGSRFWDIDGNEYLDISMGYGVHYFGYQPDFVVDALRDQLGKGFHIGPQAAQAGDVASLLCELTGMSRAAFCNSGTEAVSAAIRFARAATNRTRFVMFEGSYHGWSDHTLALPAGPKNSIPMARGIGAGAMNDVVVLEYGSPESLDIIRGLASDLAAVIVEPVQSRRPDLQPIAFLKELREITRASGTALIFDEVVTGFRVHPGGAQVWSGVDADLATYGKILGGGMPIGAVAGRERFMDTIDGGPWNYGDDSSPSVPTTFFGGTFNKNPLTMASTHAVLTRVKAEGPALQQRVAENVVWLANDFNAFCRREGFPLRVVHFSSVFRFIGEGEYSLQRFPLAIDLFFHLLTLHGIYVLETRVCFLSTSHTPEDLRTISETAKACLNALRGGGFFESSRPATAPLSQSPVGHLARDAQLDGDFAVPPGSTTGVQHDVLLTGATGFLGAHLAKGLLERTTARVHCLVRARDDEHARQRVIDNLAAHGCLDDEARSRIIGFAGDLSSPQLGLPLTVWRQLADRIGAIYHNGALVNSLLSYDRLRPANVEGTRELLRLAVDGRAKAFHYVSSDAVFDAYGYQRLATIYEDEPLAYSDTLYGGGYAETKWVAEKLVENARAAGLHASVYRPGAITAAVTSGCGQLGDFFARFIKGIVQLGTCPELDAVMDFAPVDCVSQMIVELSLNDGGGRTFHLTHRDPLTYQQFVDVIRDAGYDVEVLPLSSWEASLHRLRYEDGNALYPMLPLFTDSSAPVFRRARLDVRNAIAGAPALSESCPPLLELLPVYLARFRAEGFLPRPTSVTVGART